MPSTLVHVALGLLIAAGIVPDLAVGGVNAFYSTDRGWVQTCFERTRPEQRQVRTTKNVDFRTVLDAEKTLADDADAKHVERIFPVAMTGFRAWLLPVAVVVTGVRLRHAKRSEGR